MLVVFPSMTLNVWNFSNLPKLVAYLIRYYQVRNFRYILILFYSLCNLISLYIYLLYISHSLRSLPYYRAQEPCANKLFQATGVFNLSCHFDLVGRNVDGGCSYK